MRSQSFRRVIVSHGNWRSWDLNPSLSKTSLCPKCSTICIPQCSLWKNTDHFLCKRVWDWLILLRQRIRSFEVQLPGLSGNGAEAAFAEDLPHFLLVPVSVKLKSELCLSHPAWERDLCAWRPQEQLASVRGAEPLPLWALFSDLDWSSLRSSMCVSLLLVGLFFFPLGNSIFLAWFLNCGILINISH